MGASLLDVAVAALARLARERGAGGMEARALEERVREGADLAELAALRARPVEGERALVELGAALDLTDAELCAAALVGAVEVDPLLGRIVAWLQAPMGGSRPTLGLLAAALRCDADAIFGGEAVACGLLVVGGDAQPLAERAVAIPPHLLLALRGRPTRLPGVRIGADAPVPLPPSIRATADQHALGLATVEGRVLAVRSAIESESTAAAIAIADALGRGALFVEAVPAGLVPLLHLTGTVPVFVKRLGPGEQFRVPSLPGWRGPVLVVTGVEGGVEAPSGAVLTWRVPIPDAGERVDLWRAAIGDGPLAATLGRAHRHGAGRISELGRLATHHAAVAGRAAPDADDVLSVSLAEDGGLGALAQALTLRVDDAALVIADTVRRDLEVLVARCRQREGLTDRLGPSARLRAGAGVRVLFVGPSGTGKTLAAAWLGTRLSLPLHRVDVASIVSKYIGETEKNLADLLARAEAAEVVLFFDEADTLFGKRTDVSHSSDRFANSQTNYLLQRIETYEGIVVLASNSRARFDPAFSRRLDLVVEFPLPGPAERRALWEAHLGTEHALSARDLNRVAAHCDLAGGHVRNAVLAAAVVADGRPIGWADLVCGLRLECRKLGVPLPAILEAAPAAEPVNGRARGARAGAPS